MTREEIDKAFRKNKNNHHYDHIEDILKIQSVIEKYLNFFIYEEEIVIFWEWYSESYYAAGWAGLPEDREIIGAFEEFIKNHQ
jgi:hypothetical protein